MALNDMLQIFNIAMPNFLQHDYNLCAKTIDGILNTLNDSNGDVQNMAIKCLGPFVNKAPDTILAPMIEKVSTLSTSSTVENSIPALALREIVVSLPRPIPGAPRSKGVLDAYSAVSKALIPRLTGYTVMPLGRKDMPTPPKGMLETDKATGQDSNAIDVLIEVARCFGPMLHEKEVDALLSTTYDILEAEHAGSVLKKKAVVAISTLATHFSDQLLSNFTSRLIENLRDSHLTRSKRKLYITILGSMARSIPRKFGPHLKTIAPFVLSALSAEELDEEMTGTDDEGERDPEADEVREAALVALEAFLSFCSSDMTIYTEETIDACVRFLKYDPNVADDEDDADADDDDNDDSSLEGDDFEEEDGYDDEDDVSWKVRRSAAKALSTLVTTRGKGDLLEDGTLYTKVAPKLVSRFKEREESVRLETLATLSALVRVSREETAVPTLDLHEESTQSIMGPPLTRKRRRGGSDASMFDSHSNHFLSHGLTSAAANSPLTGPRARLAKIVPDIVRGISQLLQTGPLTTKQASIVLLKDIVITQQGRLDDYLSQLIDPIIDAVKATGSQHHGHFSSGSSTATANSLRIESLHCLGAIADLHASNVIEPFLPKLVPAIITASQDKYSKVSVEALTSLEQVMNALTPPRATSKTSQNQKYIEQIFDVLSQRTSSRDVDLEVRKKAVHVLALLIGRTSAATDLLPQVKRQAGLEVLLERLRNEITRLATARAISELAALAQSKTDLNKEWVCNVSLELGAQLRKASRSLRGASLQSLEIIALTPACREHLDSQTTDQLVELLLPLLTANDLHLLRPALVILTKFVQENGQGSVTSRLSDPICAVVQSSVSGSSVHALQGLVRAIGEKGAGQELMRKLLNVGTAGNPDLLGKAVGTLLVYGGPNLGVKLEQFVGELKQNDERKQCLAITVLGEAGLLLEKQFPLSPDVFTSCFEAKGEQLPLTAAVALGRAGAGNVEVYLPYVIKTMGQKDSQQYLLMHSIKEMLQHPEAEEKVKPYAPTLWQNLVAGSQAEDNRAIGAECIGRLAIIEPEKHLGQLQVSRLVFGKQVYPDCDIDSNNYYLSHSSMTVMLAFVVWSFLRYDSPFPTPIAATMST